MPETLEHPTLDIAQRQALITALPCFSGLSSEESAELAILMIEVKYAPHEKIVIEDELVDSVYIIVNGQAEVTRDQKIKTKITHAEKHKTIPVAIIGPGETIGLNDTGFFSETGKRTATVTAFFEVHVLKLDLKNMHVFFANHAHLKSDMLSATEQMLKMKLIKQSLPFNKISHERLRWLAEHVEEVSVEKGQLIFEKGEQGDRCYLIRSGQVEILEKNADGSEKHLAILKPPTLFGEATLITNSPRNATARAAEDSELLELKYEYLSELLESEKNVANMFMTLMVDRSRPESNPHVVVHDRTTADDQHVVILKNPDNGNYFKLSKEGWFVWQNLNGKQTMQEITLKLADEFNIFAPDIVAGLVSKLAKSGFIINLDLKEEDQIENKAKWARAVWRVRCILEKRVAIGDADKWLSTLYKKCGYLLFTRLGKIILATIAICGFGAFAVSTPHIIHVFKTIPDSWILFLFLIPFTIISVACHEMGHALATKSFGYEVHYMGVGWYWLSPVAFTDTSDMWLSTRWPRIVVNLAGVYTDSLFAGICSILIFIIPSGYAQGFLWLFALFTYVNAFRMLSPLQELDGYYVLMDLLDRPRLRQTSVMWLIKDLPKAIRKPSLFRKSKVEISYWLSCIVFLILVSLLTLFVQTFVFKILGIHSSNIFVSLALPFMVVVISSITILAELRSKSED